MKITIINQTIMRTSVVILTLLMLMSNAPKSLANGYIGTSRILQMRQLSEEKDNIFSKIAKLFKKKKPHKRLTVRGRLKRFMKFEGIGKSRYRPAKRRKIKIYNNSIATR